MKKGKTIRFNRINMFAAVFGAMLYLLIGSFLLIYATTLFNVGYHNLDLSQNMISIEYYTGLEIQDIGSDYKLHDYQDMYITGHNQMKQGFYYAILGGFLIGIAFVLIPYIHDLRQ